MGLKLLTVQLLTLLMNVSEPANSANRLGLIDRVSPGQIVDRQHLSCREHTHVAFW